MGKFFKVFGISAAIGTLAYALFKYKHDEKFKEKADEKMGEVKVKAKETVSKAFDKACIFAVDHPKVALGIVGGVTIGGSALLGAAICKGADGFKAWQLGRRTHNLEGKELEQHEKWWDDNGYGDNYRNVYELARDLPLHEDESFGIARYDVDGQTVTCVLQEYKDGNQIYLKKDTF